MLGGKQMRWNGDLNMTVYDGIKSIQCRFIGLTLPSLGFWFNDKQEKDSTSTYKKFNSIFLIFPSLCLLLQKSRERREVLHHVDNHVFQWGGMSFC